MVPIAWRRRDKTMTILVNEVNMIRIAGARERTVNKRKICRTMATSPGSFALSGPMLKKGKASDKVSPPHVEEDIPIRITNVNEIMI